MKTNTLQVGTILKGKEYEYRIEKVLGQGSFGITYLAETKVAVSGSLGKLNTFAKVKVAIKEFFLQEMNSRSEDGSLSYTDGNSLFQNYGKKFKKEALNLAKLSHPNIVNVLEYFEANNTFYYAMEFIEGSSLDDYIKRKGKLEEQEALKYLQQTASALEYMHSHKMLHLDLKPKNIMLNTNNDAVLIDFGLSKQYSENGEPESSTSIGLGTPGYAPIEQNTQNEKDFSPTIDVYSLGATLYKMLSGKTPPQASLVLNDGLDLSNIKERNISEKTISLLEKMMSPLKKNRPQNMTEVLNLLQTTSQTQHTEEDNTTKDEEDTFVNKQNSETEKDNTTVKERNITIIPPKEVVEKPKNKEKNNKKILFIILNIITVISAVLLVIYYINRNSYSDFPSISSTISNTESVTEEVAETVEEIKDTIEEVKQIEKKVETTKEKTLVTARHTESNERYPVPEVGIPPSVTHNAYFTEGFPNFKNISKKCREENILRVNFTIQANGVIPDTPLIILPGTSTEVANCLKELYNIIKKLDWKPAINGGHLIEQEAILTLDGDSYHIDYYPDVTKKSSR